MQDDYTPERGSEAWDEMYGDEKPWFQRRRFIFPIVGTLLVGTCMSMTSRHQPTASAETAMASVSTDSIESREEPMDFESCIDLIGTMAAQFGRAPTNIVETSAMRMVRFQATDGSVLVTCNALDDKIIVTKSPSI